jgi:hypothetical protein
MAVTDCTVGELDRSRKLQDPFPGWHRRGRPVLEGSDKLVRVDPDADATDGFFIALFVRQRQGKQAHKQQREQAAAEKDGVALVDEPKNQKKKSKKRKG